MRQPTAAPAVVGIFGEAHPRHGERLIRLLLMTAALLSVVTTVGIVFALASETWSFFKDVPLLDFLFGTEWSPLFSDPQYGVLPLLSGTLTVTAIAIVVAVPLGVGSAIYLSEYAHPRTRKLIKPALELLAGIPTIVFGYFALVFLTPLLRDKLGLDLEVFNALSAGLVVGILVVPIIASISEDALSAVPSALRAGAFGLGASNYQVSTRIVVPAALSGIVASIVLGVSRAIGETMVVLVAGGLRPNLSPNVTQPMETMTAFIAATGKGDVPAGSVGYKTIFAVGALLFVITFFLNTVSARFVRRFREVYE